MKITSTKTKLNVNCKKAGPGKRTSNEGGVISLDREDEFINTIISQLPKHSGADVMKNRNVTLLKLPDAEINFDKICRTCLATNDMKCTFDNMYDGTTISTLLEQCVSISVQDDTMPQYMCNTCVSELINCYMFKKKCLQAQQTLEEIIKYSNMRRGACWNEKAIQIPFLLHKLELIQFITNDDTQEDKQEGNCEEQETATSEPNINDTLNKLDIRKGSEATTQNIKEEIGYDADQGISKYENENMKDKNVNDQTGGKMLLDCSRCDKVFESSEELKRHLREAKHPKKRWNRACYICGKIFSSHHMVPHLRTHTKEKPYKCKICPKAFSLSCNLKRHSMLHTGEKPYVCDFCGKGYIQADSLRDHICTHTGQKPFLCETCGKGFIYRINFNEHKCVQSSDTLLKCGYCGKKFNQALRFHSHLQRHQTENPEPSRLKELQCCVCKKKIYGEKALNEHLLTHHKKTYLCSHCGKQFYHNTNYQSHLRIHTGDKPNTCPECGKSFSQAGSLKIHMLIHSGQRPFKCHICSKTFIQRGHLDCHMKTHTGERPYKCSYCSKSFALNGTLTIHVRTHTGETPFICDVCGRGFYHSSSMKKHKRGHDNVKVFKKTSST